MSEDQKSHKTPYVPWGTYLKFLADLAEAPIPSYIDKSLMPSMSGGIQSILINALRATNMINGDGVPTRRLHDFVAGDEGVRKRIVADGLKDAFPFFFDGQIDLTRATPGQFDKVLRESGGLNGSTLDKSAKLFLSAAEYCELSIGSHLKARKPSGRKPASGNRKASPSKNSNIEPEISSRPGVPNPNQEVMSEKALEYRLVDLMTEAMTKDPTVMDSIIKVITFIKTKDVAQAESGDAATSTDEKDQS